MKVEELMIGDWVLNQRDKKHVQVMGIRPGSRVEIVYNGEYDLKKEVFFFLKPIPLTEEILEKNGFTSKTYDAGDMEYTLWSSKDERIQICDFSNSRKKWTAHIDNEDYETIGSANVDCVHELQHLLKLCEIEMEIKI